MTVNFSVFRPYLLLPLLLAFVLISADVDSAELKQIRAINQQQNLINGSVRDLVFDEDGTVWLATMNGLVHYDGYRFDNFGHKADDANSLSSSNIYALAFDKQQRLWLATGHKLGYLNPKTRIYTAIQSESIACDTGIKELTSDKEGNIWGSNNGNSLLYYQVHNNQASCFNLATEDGQIPADLVIGALTYDNIRHSVWLATSKGLVRFDVRTKKSHFIAQTLSSQPHPVLSLAARGLTLDDKGNVWVGTIEQGVYRYNLSTKRYQHYTPREYPILQGQSFTNLTIDSDGTAWLCTHNAGLLQLSGENIIEYPGYDPLNKRDLPPTIFKTVIDKHNNLWLATYLGVFIKPSNNTGISAINLEKLTYGNQKLVLTGIHFTNEEQLLLGTNAGLFKWQNQRLTRLDDERQPTMNISGIYQVDRSLFYLCNTQGFASYQPDSHIIKSIKNSDNTRWCADFAKGKDSTLWIASQHYGLSQFDLNSQQMAASSPFINSKLNQFSRSLMALHLDKKQRLWIGTADKGLAMLAVNTGVLSVFEEPNNQPAGSMITDIVEDARGFIWLTTFKGLSRLDPNSGEFIHFHVEQGLSSELLNHIEIDADGELWISSQSGLNKVNPVTFDVTRYLQSDSLWEDEYSIHYMTQDNLGKLYVAGVNAVTIIEPKELKQPVAHHQNLISSVTIDEQPMDWHVQPPLTFAKSPDLITINFATTDYFAAHATKFRYKMTGLNDRWHKADATASVYFTNLGHGDYTFEVQGKTPAGNWLTPAATMHLVIAPPWYLSYWAFALYVVGFMGLVYLQVIISTSAQIRKAKALQKQVDTQTGKLNRQNQKISELLTKQQTLFVQLSHEIRTPLTLIFAPWQKLNHQHRKQYQSLCDTADYNQKRLLLLLDQLLDIAQHGTSKNNDKQPVPVFDVINWVQAAIRPLTDSKSQTLTVDIKHPGHIAAINDSLEKILLNLLINAHKYTHANAHIQINAYCEQQQVFIEVIDNGPGIAKSQQQAVFECFERLNADSSKPGSGVGLALVAQLVQNNNGTITLQSDVNEGCRFILCFALVQPTRQVSYQAPDGHIELPIDLVSPPAIEALEHTLNSDNLPTILVVEDNLQLQQYIQQVLSPDYYVLLATDGKSGVECAIEHIPDIVISDIMMPIMDGYQLLEAIKSHPATNHIPVVLLTAKTSKQSLMTALSFRADEYVNKPFDYQILRLKLNNLLHLRDMWHQRYQQQNQATPHSTPDANPGIMLQLNPQNQVFIDQLTQLCEQHCHDSQFGIDELAEQLNMNKRQLQRKVKALLGTTPLALLKDVRLDLACQAIVRGEQITQVGYVYGFNSYVHFARAFKEKYQHSPKHYLENRGGHPL